MGTLSDQNAQRVGIDPAGLHEGPSGSGDVVGPSSAVDGHLAVFADETGKLIEDGGAPGGGGSFLSANIARVDPSGNDGTGEVGDLSKPFLTVQAAVNAIEALDPIPEWPVIEVGLFPDASVEEVTTSLLKLAIRGVISRNAVSFSGDLPNPFEHLIFTATDDNIDVILENVFGPSSDIIIPSNSGSNVRIQLLNSYLSAILADGQGVEPPGTGFNGAMRVDGGGNSTITDIYTLGVCYVSNFTNPVNVTVGDDANVYAYNSQIGGVNSTPGDLPASALNLINSIVLSSNAAVTSIEQQDLLIKPPTSDPEIEGVLWNDNGTPTISAGPPP